MKATDVEKVLKDTADDLGTSGWDTQFGYGRVNAYRALMFGCISGGKALPAINLLLLN